MSCFYRSVQCNHLHPLWSLVSVNNSETLDRLKKGEPVVKFSLNLSEDSMQKMLNHLKQLCKIRWDLSFLYPDQLFSSLSGALSVVIVNYYLSYYCLGWTSTPGWPSFFRNMLSASLVYSVSVALEWSSSCQIWRRAQSSWTGWRWGPVSPLWLAVQWG